MEKKLITMGDLNLTEPQVKELVSNLAKEIGIEELLKMVFESIMYQERELFNKDYKTVSNGFRSRKITRFGKVLELRVPRVRQGGFYPLLLAILKDQEEEAMNLAFALYQRGLTNKDIGEIFELLYGRHYSTSRINQLVSAVREDIEIWQNRPLEPYYPILYIDAIYQQVVFQKKVQKLAFYIVLALKKDFTREVLAIEVFPTENATNWEFVFEDLRNRGLKEVSLVVSDALPGIDTAVSKHLHSEHQLCTTHLKRKIVNLVKREDKSLIAEDLKEVFQTDNKNDTVEKGWERWLNFISKWQANYPSFKRFADRKYSLYFTYLSYDFRIRSMIYTTNWVERLNREFRRVIRMRGALPKTDSVISLFIGVAMNIGAYNHKLYKFKYEKKFKFETENDNNFV